MHFQTILAIARKDAIDVIKNKQTLFALLSPIFMAIFFVFFQQLISDKDTTNKILIYDPDQSNVSITAQSVFNSSEIVYAKSAEEVSSAFGTDGAKRDSQYAMGLIVPASFEANIRQGEKPQVTLYTNAEHMSQSQRLASEQLLTDYAYNVANPEPIITLKHATINPPTEDEVFDIDSLGNMYTGMGLLFSLYIGLFLLPSLLIEEKEKKTIRMLMVSPASFADIVLGKMLVCLGYQLLLSVVVVATMQGFSGNVPLLLLIILLGSCMSLAIGLLIGCVFKSTTAATSVGGGFGSLLLMLPGLLTGPFGEFVLGNNPAGQALKVLPSYYLADATYIALLNQNRPGEILLDVAVICGCIVVFVILGVWALRRQATVVASI